MLDSSNLAGADRGSAAVVATAGICSLSRLVGVERWPKPPTHALVAIAGPGAAQRARRPSTKVLGRVSRAGKPPGHSGAKFKMGGLST
jgi:hypothetical protein